jgi:hypothetical protein
MLNHTQALRVITRLQPVSNALAEELKVIKDRMEGRGVNPKDAPIIIDRLNEIEAKLRMLGSNPDNPIPFDR